MPAGGAVGLQHGGRKGRTQSHKLCAYLNPKIICPAISADTIELLSSPTHGHHRPKEVKVSQICAGNCGRIPMIVTLTRENVNCLLTKKQN